MNNVNAFGAVKARVDLRAFLEAEVGAKFDRIGSGLRANVCPACGLGGGTSHKLILLGQGEKWKCFSCGERGDVLDAAQALWGISLREALYRLGTEAPPLPLAPREPTPEVKDQARKRAVREVLVRLRAGVLTQGLNQQTVDYLVSRGISERVVREGARRGLLGALPPDQSAAIRWLLKNIGRERMEAAGMWSPDKKAPAAAYRPLVFFLGEESAEFRMIRKPGPKERKALRYGETSLPWLWIGRERSKAVVTEGAIDLLSMVELGYKGDIIGLPGAGVWSARWFQRYAQVTLCLDPDKAGQDAATGIVHACQEAGIKADNRPPKGGDVNEFLRNRATVH